MRCDCGFSLTEEKKCILTPSNLVGCEVLNKNNACIRPKADYTLIISESAFKAIEYGRGSHCEIRNLTNKKCEQCHSGFFIDDKRICQKSKPISNEFFSYYSLNGQIVSRDIELVSTPNGVFQQIKYCIMQKGLNDLKTSICEKCQFGKVFNQNRSACFKPPFEECGMVSNEDPNKCIECLSNHNFYLKTYEIQGLQQCIPREQDLLEKCLVEGQENKNCKLCADGFLLTENGCSFMNIQEVPIKKLKFNLSDFMPDNCQFVDENFQCQSCKEQYVMNSKGKCQISYDIFCMIAFEDGSCKKCRSFMEYSFSNNSCMLINDLGQSQQNTGQNNYCDKCVKGSFLNAIGNCIQKNIPECFEYSNENICIRCHNLYYLENGNCIFINFKNCLLSDGISKKCLKCKKYFIIDSDENCKPAELKEDEFLCQKNLFYTSIIENKPKCIEYTNKSYCVILNNTQDECLECLSSFYLEEGKCKQIENCLESDGINMKCLSSNPRQMFANSTGAIEMMKIKCDSNGMENICTTCQFDEQQSGIYFGEKCIPYYQLSPQLKNSCLHLKKQGNEYECELCISTMYLNKDGICIFMEDYECILTNGRTKDCILCEKFYQIDQTTKKCKPTNQYFPNCKEIINSSCFQCENLYYLEENFCIPISDPDCLNSNGLHNACDICKNFLIQPQFSFSYFSFCEELDQSSKSCLKCPDGFVLRESKRNNEEDFICEKRVINDCQDLNDKYECSKCEDGYIMAEINQNQIICAQIYIENCKILSENKYYCVACTDGYLLLPNGKCQAIKGCKELNKKCMKCQKDYYLSFGQCFKIKNCKEQLNDICLKCQEEYQLSKKMNFSINEKNFKDIIFEQCQEIPNCIKSNEVFGCLECKSGYQLKHFICYKSKQTECINYDSNNQCKECKNLFFLEDGECKKILHSNCNESNGINNQCIRCEANGFYQSIEQEKMCTKMPNCLISNGVDACKVCEKDFFPNVDGQCVVFKIENCKYLSTQPTLQILQKEFHPNLKEIISINTKMVQNLNYIPPIGCIQCDNFYYLKTFEECSLVIRSYYSNCLETNSIIPRCQICFPGYYLLIRVSQNIPQCFNKQKKLLKINNIGCSIFTRYDICFQCFPNYYLSTESKCIERERYSKCDIFNSTKDECLICKSGYLLIELIENKKVCIKLNSSQEVENCKIYKANSNKCQECMKLFEEDFMEFFLNEEQNICEPVIDLMCHQIDTATKSCLVPYIPLCQEQRRSKNNSTECIRCNNGFYFDKDSLNCKENRKIENCLLYNQQKVDSCKQCYPLYFLQLDHTCSNLINPHCQTFFEDKDGCQYCEEEYAIDYQDGTCAETQIENCKIIKQELKSEQICLECLENYVLKHQGNLCLFQILDMNCEEFNGDYECLKCILGYFLTIKGDCIDLSSVCQIQNCLIFDPKSSQDNILCEQCLPNYSINYLQKCSPYDPDSEIKPESSGENEILNEEINIQIFLIILILIICSLGLFWKFFKKRKTANTQIREEERNPIQFSIEVSSNQEEYIVNQDDLSLTPPKNYEFKDNNERKND